MMAPKAATTDGPVIPEATLLFGTEEVEGLGVPEGKQCCWNPSRSRSREPVPEPVPVGAADDCPPVALVDSVVWVSRESCRAGDSGTRAAATNRGRHADGGAGLACRVTATLLAEVDAGGAGLEEEGGLEGLSRVIFLLARNI